MARTYELSRGLRVRLRLVRLSDLPGLEELALACRLDVDGLGLARLVRRDPRERVVICATALVDGAERVVGVGAIDVAATEPDLLVVEEGTDGLAELVAGALAGRAAWLGRASAA